MYALSPPPLQNIPSLWTASDIADMQLLQTKLDWLCKESRHGNGLCPARHELAIRDVLRIGQHLAAKEEAFAKAYNPQQPRVPAGNPDGGQWTDGSGGGGSRLPRRKPVPHPAMPPHPMADSPYYDPVTGIYDPPLNPALSPLDLIGGVAKPAAGAIGSGARSTYNAIRLRRYLDQARQIPKGVREAGRGTEHLTVGQRKALKDFSRSRSRYKKEHRSH